jgi:hypothetical protein
LIPHPYYSERKVLERNDLLLLRYCKSSLRDLRKVCNKLFQEETVNSRRYLSQSFLYRNNREILIRQITGILKEYNDNVENPDSSEYWIDEKVFFLVKEFQLEMFILLSLLSQQISAIEEEKNFYQKSSKE